MARVAAAATESLLRDNILMTAPGSKPLVYLAVFLLCGATLALEIALTRVLAFMMWHHFTYVVIGVALLGFGAAGSYLTKTQHSTQDPRFDPESTIAGYAMAAGIAAPLAYLMLTRVHFAPLRIADEPEQVVSLLLIYGIIAAPFFFSGLAICGAITFYRGHIGAVYFADLLGAGAGAIAVTLTIEPLTGPGLIIVLSALQIGAAVCFWLSSLLTRKRLSSGLGALLALVVGTSMLVVLLPPARRGRLDPPLDPSKDMAMVAAQRALEVTRWSATARIDVGRELVIQPMMGGVFRHSAPMVPVRPLFQDAAAPTLFLRDVGEPSNAEFLRQSTTGVGFPALRSRGIEHPEVLVIGVGGGVDLLIGLAHGARHVTGAEINRVTLDLLRDQFSDYTGKLAQRRDVELVHAEGRHFVRSAGRKFDLIQLSGVDTYTALSSGAYALSESYLYTREALLDFLQALTPAGVVSYSRFLFPDKPRETLRLAATAVAALEQLGLPDAHNHLFVMYGEGAHPWAALLASRTPFAPAALDAMRAFVAENGFKVVFDPAQPRDTAWDACLRVPPAARVDFFARYPYDVAPASDDRPFFFNFFKWAGLLRPHEFGGHVYVNAYPVGHLMLLVALLQTLVLGAVFILRPLRTLPRSASRQGTLGVLLFFSALGFGFIVLEIALIQTLVLFLGHPMHATTVVLPTMLVAAGIGALTVRAQADPRRRLRWLAVVAPGLIVATWLATRELDRALALGYGARVALTVALLAPVSIALGMCLPCGIRVLDKTRPELVPWAWAVNGFTSVLGSTSAVVLAMEVGFSAVMLATAGVYAVGLLAFLRSLGRGPDLPATPATSPRALVVTTTAVLVLSVAGGHSPPG
jgi:spermidine synthase